MAMHLPPFGSHRLGISLSRLPCAPVVLQLLEESLDTNFDWPMWQAGKFQRQTERISGLKDYASGLKVIRVYMKHIGERSSLDVISPETLVCPQEN